MGAVEHVRGLMVFLIEEKDVSVTEFRRKTSAVWRYLEPPGHVIFLTRRKVHITALMPRPVMTRQTRNIRRTRFSKVLHYDVPGSARETLANAIGEAIGAYPA